MATIGSNKCTKYQHNYQTNTDNNTIIGKSCAQILDQNSCSHKTNCNNNNNSHPNGRPRPQLRWSQSFSPNDRQKPNVSTLIRRKSAVERLAETKYNYIKSSPTPPAVDTNANEKQRFLTKSLSTSALKPSLVILTQTPATLVSNPSVDSQQNQNSFLKQTHQTLTLQSTLHSNHSPATPSQVVVPRKRNPSLSSRLSSESSHNLEQQLRQLIADECEEQSLSSSTTSVGANRLQSIPKTNTNSPKVETKVISVKKGINNNNNNNSSPVVNKPIPKERLKTVNQKVSPQNQTNVVPKQRTVFPAISTSNTKSNDKTIIANNSKKSFANNNNNSSILRYNSSHNNNQNNSKLANNLSPKLIITTTNKPKLLAQPLAQEPKPTQLLAVRAVVKPTLSVTPTQNSRQLSISRSKSDVSNRLLVKRNKSKDEIERFFETLGLDSTVWDTIKSEATNSLISTPAHYFQSCDSFESTDIKANRQRVVSSGSSSSSSTDRHSTSAQPYANRNQTLNTRLMQSRSCHALSSGTSIVEKNARVIKWLYNCRKAMV